MGRRSLAAALAAILACASAAAEGEKPPVPSPAGPASASGFLEEQRRLEEAAAGQARSPSAEEVAGLYRRWFDSRMRPRLEATRREPRELPCLVAEYARWRACLRLADERLVRPAGAAARLLAGEVGAALSAIDRGRAAILGVASRPCVQGREPWLILRLLQAREVIHALFEVDGRASPPEPAIGEAWACLTFEVSIRSTLDGRSADGRARMRHALEAKALVAPVAEPHRGGGPARAMAVPSLACDDGAPLLPLQERLRLSSAGVGDRTAARDGGPPSLVSEWRSGDPGFGEDRKAVEVRFEVEEATVDLGGVGSCSGVATAEPRWSVAYGLHQGPVDSEDFLTFYWRDLHREESTRLRGSMNDYLADGFEKGPGEVLAQRTYRQTKPAGGYLLTEDTRIEVRHAPR